MNTTNYHLKYTLVRSFRRKRTISLAINKKGKVVVRAPSKANQKEIKKFVEEKSAWIRKKQKERRLNPPPKRKTFANGERFLYLGNYYKLKVAAANNVKKTRLELKNNRFILRTPKKITKKEKIRQAGEAFQNWYKTAGKKEMETRVARLAKKLSTEVNIIRIKDVKSIWGSCSPKKNLTFSWKLMMAPKAVINYLAIHEVCHLKVRGHGKEFWQLVASLDPDYKVHQQWLKDNRRQLVL